MGQSSDSHDKYDSRCTISTKMGLPGSWQETKEGFVEQGMCELGYEDLVVHKAGDMGGKDTPG